MTGDSQDLVPVWALATEPVSVTNVLGDRELTPSRLTELRTVLAALAESPVATLEAHPITTSRDRKGAIPLGSASPLAQQLAQLVSQTAKTAPAKLKVGASGEALYRMVVPAKVAAQVGSGLVRPMTSKAVTGGIHSALRSSSGIAAQATFVPVAGQAAVAGPPLGPLRPLVLRWPARGR